MRAVVQRVKNAEVEVDGSCIGKIGEGLLVLLGVGEDDTEKQAQVLASKIAQLRIFRDENDKMNLSVLDIDGEILVISNFTLYGETRKGRRPNFIKAASPEKAEQFYEMFVELLKENNVKKVETGEFGGDMKVSLLNNGPVTIIMDTEDYACK